MARPLSTRASILGSSKRQDDLLREVGNAAADTKGHWHTMQTGSARIDHHFEARTQSRAGRVRRGAGNRIGAPCAIEEYECSRPSRNQDKSTPRFHGRRIYGVVADGIVAGGGVAFMAVTRSSARRTWFFVVAPTA